MCVSLFSKETGSMVVVRDTKTTGSLLPEARTTVYRLPDDQEEEVSIVSVVSGKKFLVIASSENRIGIFPTDSMSPILPDPNIPSSNKKSTTPVLGTRVEVPVWSHRVDVEKWGRIISVQLAKNDSSLFVCTTKGVAVIPLTEPAGELKWLLAPPEKEEDVGLGLVVDDRLALAWSTKGTLLTGISSNGIEIGDNVTRGAVGGCLVGLARGSESVVLIDLQSNTQYEAKLSGQCGEVSHVHIISNTNGIAVVVTQRDVVSIFHAINDSNSLELVFQFRDAINKLQFTCTDLLGSYLLTISSDSFSRRDRLELYDLSFLKPKSAGLSPLRRWDISRLTADVVNPQIYFVGRKNKELLSFILTTAGGSASLWEPVVRDQWFSVMSNFEALNKNEPYREREEEFDFNQKADLDTVRRTINRYKKSDNVVFDFIPQSNDRNVLVSSPDVDMGYAGMMRSENEEELLFPFLQPLDSWRSRGPVVEGLVVGVNPQVNFFSESAKKVLANRS